MKTTINIPSNIRHVVKCNGLQIRKIVSSNLTLISINLQTKIGY